MIGKSKVYGNELIMDVIGCDLKIISSKKKLLEYVIKVCKLIKMKRYGKPFCEKFGLGADFTAGYSVVQLIETSSITGHFSDLWCRAYINIFSCKEFNKKIASEFTKKFFKAQKIKEKFLIR